MLQDLSERPLLIRIDFAECSAFQCLGVDSDDGKRSLELMGKNIEQLRFCLATLFSALGQKPFGIERVAKNGRKNSNDRQENELGDNLPNRDSLRRRKTRHMRMAPPAK